MAKSCGAITLSRLKEYEVLERIHQDVPAPNAQDVVAVEAAAPLRLPRKLNITLPPGLHPAACSAPAHSSVVIVPTCSALAPPRSAASSSSPVAPAPRAGVKRRLESTPGAQQGKPPPPRPSFPPSQLILTHPRDATVPALKPDAFLDRLLAARGYPATRINSLTCPSIRQTPTAEMTAGYTTPLLHAVRDNRCDEVARLAAEGICMDACNRFGESVLHLACRRGSCAMVTTLISNGASVRVVDDFGRTPLHDSCWTPEPSFDLCTLLLDLDSSLLLLLDRRGSSPLDYVRVEHWHLWCDFLDRKKDSWIPLRTSAVSSRLVASLTG